MGWSAYLPFRAEFAALNPDRYSGRYIDEQVKMGFWRCWGTDEAAILAEIKVYPSGLKEVHGVAAAGDLRAILGLIPMAVEWGRENGCVRAVIESRPGWERALPKEWTVHQVAMRKEL